jgi:hypothetical protein
MEQPVQQRGLKREFRLADLVPMQVLLISQHLLNMR